MRQPTVCVRIGESFIARSHTGDIIETVDFIASAVPDWSQATVCDHRGLGGPEAYVELDRAFRALEANCRAAGEEPEPVGRGWSA